VEAATPAGAALNQFNRISFKPVTTIELKLEARLKEGGSAGILEWKTE